MQDTFINLLGKLPNWFVGVPKLKCFYTNRLNKDLFRFCQLTKSYKIEINLNNFSENYLWFGCKPINIDSFLQKHLKPESVFVDCGANIGIWSIIASEYINNKGEIHSIEPNPEIYLRLKRNLNHNNLQNKCKVYSLALSNDNGDKFLYLDDFNHQMSTLSDGIKGKKKVNVTSRTLDSFNLNNVDGIKIDVEGYELQVLEGSMKTISNLKPWLVIELNNTFHKIQKIIEWEVYKYLRQIGYTTNFDPNKELDFRYCEDIVFFDSKNTEIKKFVSFL